MYHPTRCIRLCVSMLICTTAISCTTQSVAPEAVRQTSLRVSAEAAPANQIRVYVSAVNCEMNAADSKRLNQLAMTGGLAVEVVFAGSNVDSSIVRQAKSDLGLDVSARMLRSGELEQYKSIGGAGLPVALVIKARQLKTLIAGESMPRTLSLLEASMSPTGGR